LRRETDTTARLESLDIGTGIASQGNMGKVSFKVYDALVLPFIRNGDTPYVLMRGVFADSMGWRSTIYRSGEEHGYLSRCGES
jgi:hypothetical protein